MTTADIKRFGLILEIQAEIEGMKAENLKLQVENLGPAYDSYDFKQMAKLLSEVVNKHDDQL